MPVGGSANLAQQETRKLRSFDDSKGQIRAEESIGNQESLADKKPHQSAANEQESFWDFEKAKKHAADYNSPQTWDLNTLKKDIAGHKKFPPADFPLFPSPFPAPTYDSPGNGNGPIQTKIGNAQIVGQYVTMGKGKHSQHLFKDAADQYVSYFTILTITDGKGKPNPVSATSRNHPHYLSQGSLNTSTKSRVDWVAVQLADKNAYATVNSRIFDLRVGRVILAAPQTDGSIRFHQLDAPAMNTKEREAYMESLKENKKVVAFFSAKTNISSLHE